MFTGALTRTRLSSHSALGEHIYDAFMRARRAEWDDYRVRVSDWEVTRYMEVA